MHVHGKQHQSRMNENSYPTLDLSCLFREKEASIWYNIYETE